MSKTPNSGAILEPRLEFQPVMPANEAGPIWDRLGDKMRYLLTLLFCLAASVALANTFADGDLSSIRDLQVQLLQLHKDTLVAFQSAPMGSKEQDCATSLAQSIGAIEKDLGTVKALTWIATGMHDKDDEQRLLTAMKALTENAQKSAEEEIQRANLIMTECHSSTGVTDKYQTGLTLFDAVTKLYGRFLSRLQ